MPNGLALTLETHDELADHHPPAAHRIYWGSSEGTTDCVWRWMNLKELFNAISEELGGRPLAPGEPGRSVEGLAVDEEAEGWLGRGEVAVTGRKHLDSRFLATVAEGGAPAVIWRAEGEPPAEAIRHAEELGLGLLALSPGVPLRGLLALFARGTGREAEGEGLLRHSHAAARTLLESAGGEASIDRLADKLAGLLRRSVVVEDPVGRLIAGGDPAGSGGRGGSPPGAPAWRRPAASVETELLWMPIGAGAPAGYLWMDLADHPLGPEDVVVLYWAARALEAELGKERVRLETELGVRGDFVDDVINGHHGSVDLLLQRARYLGADLSGGALAVVVDIDDFARYLSRRRLKESAIQELKRRLADAVRLQARGLFSNFLLGPRSDNVILFLGPSADDPAGELTEKALSLAARVQRYVKGLLPDLTVSVGVGRFKDDPATLSAAYSEADVALEIGHRINGPSSVSTFEQTGTYKLLFRVLQEEPEELESFYTETLAAVVSYDYRYGTELVTTLVTYLGNDASMAKTAADLFAHRHTIRYRLERVRELTNLDVDKSEDRERLTLGIKAMQLLGHVPHTPSSFSDR